MRFRRADVEPVARSLNPFARLHLAVRGYPLTHSTSRLEALYQRWAHSGVGHFVCVA
jgi:hypothetical protein